MSASDFQFLDPGMPCDEMIALMLVSTEQADAPKGNVPAYGLDILTRTSSMHAGAISLRVGDGDAILRYAGHIGYRVDEPHRGHHFAERACRLIAPLARRHGFAELVITCDPDNAPSRRTCERLGAIYMETVDIPSDHKLFARGMRRKCRYRWVLP